MGKLRRSDTRKKARRAHKTRKMAKGGEVESDANQVSRMHNRVDAIRHNAEKGEFIKERMDKLQTNPKSLLHLFQQNPLYYFVTIPDEEYRKGLTPFEYAIKLGNPELVSGIWNGKSVYVRDYQIDDPSPYAVKLAEKYGNPAVANFLRNKGILSRAPPNNVQVPVKNNNNDKWSVKNYFKSGIGSVRSAFGRATRRITKPSSN